MSVLPLSLSLWCLNDFSVTLMKRVRHTSVNRGSAVVLITWLAWLILGQTRTFSSDTLSLMCYTFKNTFTIFYYGYSEASERLERWVTVLRLQKHANGWMGFRWNQTRHASSVDTFQIPFWMWRGLIWYFIEQSAKMYCVPKEFFSSSR